MSFRPRRALVGLVAAAAALAALPAAASATITPALTLDQSAGTTAGSSTTIGFNATFSPSSGDSVKDLSLALPPGLLANEAINGGACLISSTPTGACQVGSGTVTVGGTSTPVTLFLVKAPKPGDVGGLALVVGTTPAGVADVTLGATGLKIAFSNLPNIAPISAMSVKLTNLRLPTSCPSPADIVTLTADSYGDPTTPKTSKAPLTVTGCSSLPYNPTVTASVTKDTKGNGAAITLAITQAANESANKTIVLLLPKGLAPNAAADIPCLTGKGCTIGTATATSPLVPSLALANGTVTLGGTATAPIIAITFPTLGITIPGTVSLTTNSVTFANIADVPLSSLILNVTGPNGQKAFTTDCAPANVVGNFTAQGGQTHTSTAPIKFTGCVANPTVTGSTGGLASGHPRLKFKVTHGKGAPNVATVAIGLPGGLRFSRAAIVTHKTCTTKGKKKKCTTTTLIKGLGISGAKAQSVAIKGGKLVITLKKPAARVNITAAGPLVSESQGLRTKVKKHRVKSLKFSLKITDAKKLATTLSLVLKAH